MIKGNLVDVFTERIYPAEIYFSDGVIECVKPVEDKFNHFILPGFIDAHIHIESSMLTPSKFAETVVPHGTTSVVSDPHEIANVLGTRGIKYMIKDAATVPLNIFFTAPSCVPATPFETSGAIINAKEIDKLLDMDEIVALGEMMNFPGVLADDIEVMTKINAAKKHKKPVDGHAPLLSGEELCKYIKAGISTDHECTIASEVIEKRKLGMKIMLRQGSSAKNLVDLIDAGGDFIVSDDKHPEDLIKGHVNLMLKEAVQSGLDPIKAIKMATLNPATHYNLNKGLIAPGKAADIVIVDNLEDFNVKDVFIGGKKVASDGKPLFSINSPDLQSTFNIKDKVPDDFEILSSNKEEKVKVIEVIEGQLLTEESESVLKVSDGKLMPDIKKDILKISVLERYGQNKITNAFVQGFGLQDGAIASSVAHDSHNIIVVGTNSQDMAEAANKLVKNNGGLVIAFNGDHHSLKLPIAGLMSNETAAEVSLKLETLHNVLEDIGCKLDSPFMTMSFLALLVIPKLKISDGGLFDVEKFEFVDVIK
ncbi:MAG: adenine deaminase [Methanobacterium sp.]|uniref:adenine deaminase n=1 Tax=Methanobacterium sp. TaxID=2164 RepID=UPI003D650537|nr:adenine deaminase [Methanobacterium sp.]